MTSPRSIPCPRCGAPAGASCADPEGYTHIERADTFNARQRAEKSRPPGIDEFYAALTPAEPHEGQERIA